jgi:hypothetical protein
MIVREEDGKLVIITQIVHADLSRQIAAHWGNDSFEKPRPMADMVAAASSHDDGWWFWDDNPLLDPGTKRPYDFYKLPMTYELKIHQDTVDRVRDKEPYTRLMVSMHRSGLCYERYGTEKGWETRAKNQIHPEVKDFADRQEKWQEETKRVLSKDKRYHDHIDETHVWTNYKLLEVWDRLSLFVCWNRVEAKLFPTPKEYGQRDVELVFTRSGDRTVRIDPWPFDEEAFRVNLTTYVIKNREYQNSAEVAHELFATPSSKIVLDYEFRNGKVIDAKNIASLRA